MGSKYVELAELRDTVKVLTTKITSLEAELAVPSRVAHLRDLVIKMIDTDIESGETWPHRPSPKGP